MAQPKNSESPLHTVSRRAALSVAIGAAASATTGGELNAKAPGWNAAPIRQVSTYETVDLAKDCVDYACIQHTVLPVDPADPRPGINRNLKRMVTLIDEHAHWAGPADLLSFHAFPSAGSAGWAREEMRAVSIEVPGPETDVLAAKAREYKLWLTFGCYARDPDWPGHVLMLSVLINPKGEIVAKHWTTSGAPDRNSASELITTPHDVLPRYVEMYGRDSVMPVARTPIGNISIIGMQNDPALFSALAVKGCELCIRQASASTPTDDALITSRDNAYFTSVVANSINPGKRYVPDPVGGYGGTQIIGPNGKTMAKALGSYEEIVRTMLPLASYRKSRRSPDTMQISAERFYDSGRWG